MRMKKVICGVSVRLLLWKKKTTNVRLKPLVLQEQHINHFALKLLPTACEVVQEGDK